jgi:hypothetical protein
VAVVRDERLAILGEGTASHEEPSGIAKLPILTVQRGYNAAIASAIGLQVYLDDLEVGYVPSHTATTSLSITQREAPL